MITSPDRYIAGDSTRWKNWMSELTPSTCKMCAKKHGTIYPAEIEDSLYIPAHRHCLCHMEHMRTKQVGTSTNKGPAGVDVYLSIYGKLPDYYVTHGTAEDAGWVNWKGNLDSILPGKAIGGDTYFNRRGKLPIKNGRIWYEADIDYTSGYRNQSRILYSNDGLMFVTYDHYETFYALTKEGDMYVSL